MPRPAFWHVALGCRCPRCGRGSLFHGPLVLRPACNACGLSFKGGAASGLVLVPGSLIAGTVLWVGSLFHAPAWVHAVLWPAVAIPFVVGLVRPLKAALIAQQYRHRASGMEL